MVSRIREGYSSDKYRNIYNSYRMVFASIGEKMHDWLEWFMWHGCGSSKFLESSFRCLLESRRQSSKGHPNQQFLKGQPFGMAAAAQSLRLCLRSARGYRPSPALRALRPQPPTRFQRTLSTTIARRDGEEQGRDGEDGEYSRDFENPREAIDDLLRSESIPDEEKKMLTEMRDKWQDLPYDRKQAVLKSINAVKQDMAPLRRRIKPKRNSFWNDEETDPDLITDEVGEDEFEEDDILSMGHGKLEEHRELREYARIAIWEMPLLSSKFFSRADSLRWPLYAETMMQSSPNPSNPRRTEKCCASGTRRTWANFTRPRRKSWSSSAPRIWTSPRLNS